MSNPEFAPSPEELQEAFALQYEDEKVFDEEDSVSATAVETETIAKQAAQAPLAGPSEQTSVVSVEPLWKNKWFKIGALVVVCLVIYYFAKRKKSSRRSEDE